MTDLKVKVNVAILGVPEVTASAVYAMYDLFTAAGRDWAFIVSGVPGEQRMQPYIVTHDGAPVCSSNGVWIKADYAIGDCPEPVLICVPDFTHVPGEGCAGRYQPEVAWLRRCHADGATLASVCTSAMLMAETGLLDGLDATEEAKQSLETEDKPVEAIALEIGYEDASFFNRLFRRKVGLTPAQYRRRFAFIRRNLPGGHDGGRRSSG
jgi:transcriptional regulator GlxA family with amidase domain